MKVVHFASFSPNQCGLYHTTKDLIKAERGVGIDAYFVDVKPVDGITTVGAGNQVDGGLTTSDVSIADDADILVRHTAIPNNLENSGIPCVMAVHGRPESSMLLDERKGEPIIQALHNKGKDCRYKVFFTFWKEHLPFWRFIIPEHKLGYVPAMVDLMQWRPGGKKFDLGKYKGNPNILIADIWREDVTPFEEIMAVVDWVKNKCPEAKLHIIAVPMGKGADIFFRALRKDGVLGFVSGQTRKIDEFYQACDVVVTPHKIMTRIRREGLATGTPVINSNELDEWYKGYKLSPRAMSTAARTVAERTLNLRQAGYAAKKIFEGVLDDKPEQHKVLLDIGGHLGESVRRFYREVPDARHYEIHTFEPVKDCYDKLSSQLLRMKNVTKWQRLVIGTNEEHRNMFVGSVNAHEGSTAVALKITGGVDYSKPVKVCTFNLGDFINRSGFEDAYVVLKMNIEGGEYELMQHIIKENLMTHFDQIYIQTHKSKIEGDTALYVDLEQKFRKEAEKHCVQLFMQEKGMARFQCEGVKP